MSTEGAEVQTKAAEKGSLFVRIWRSSTDGVPAFFSYGITVVRYWKKSSESVKSGDVNTCSHFIKKRPFLTVKMDNNTLQIKDDGFEKQENGNGTENETKS